MLAVAAARLGLRVHIFDPAPGCPAGDVAHAVTQADYGDTAALRAFAESVDVVTYEFENIPTEALDAIEQMRPIRPGREALRISQDRLTEKLFLRDLGLQVAPFASVDSLADLQSALAEIGTPAILKTRRFGYDGKGQSRLKGARGLDGRVACYDPGENQHRDGILRTTTVPARLSMAQRTDAVLLAGRILNALDYVGVMGVELFVTPGGLIVNEIAPRVHNSGHWTQNGCTVDQFEQHIRAIAGWPLGDGTRHADVVMENLIGDDMDKVPSLASEARCALHLYGKAEVKPGRKMGHVNRIVEADGQA